MKTAASSRANPLFALGLLILGCLLSGCADHVSDASIENATLAEVQAYVKDRPGVARLIDTRTPGEYAAGHIPGAVQMNLGAVSERKDEADPTLEKFKTLLVYGADQGSGTPRAMAKRLLRSGHKGVKVFPGGMAEWLGAGLKVERSGSPVPEPGGTGR